MSNQLSIRTQSLYEAFQETDYFSKNDKKLAIDIFNQYCIKGVILDSFFDDTKWTLFDQTRTYQIDFNYNEIEFMKTPVFNSIHYNDFILYLKIYLVGQLGKYCLITLQTFTRETKKVVSSFNGKNLKLDTIMQSYILVQDFIMNIDLRNSKEYENLLFELEKVEKSSFSNDKGTMQRELSTFQSYFLFNDKLDDYWKQPLSEKERLFYYPMYLWWKITTILPLRPKEFLLTPRDCFKDKANPNKVTFRRTKLKKHKRKISYNIYDDYELYSYDVGDEVSDQIRKYISLTENPKEHEIDTLFRIETHYSYLGQRIHSNSIFYSFYNMYYCIDTFYSAVLHMEYEINTVVRSSDQERIGLAYNEIEYINMGDTRHLALINIIASGGTPTLSMKLAGHLNIDISSHYFSNISTLIECKTYQNYRKSISGTTNDYVLAENYVPPISKVNFVLLNNGDRCYSKLFQEGKYNDCFKVIDEEGNIGNCEDCNYYRSNNYDIFINDDSILKNKIDNDSFILAEAIKLYRQGLGYEEDVTQASLRLQSNAKAYEKYFISKIYNGDKNGKN